MNSDAYHQPGEILDDQRQLPVSNDSVYSQPEPRSPRATGRLGALSREAKNSQLTRGDTLTTLP